jgi:zinc transporter ZupT
MLSRADRRSLAVAIGLQNFPEGLAVSIPLHRAGFSKGRAFM